MRNARLLSWEAGEVPSSWEVEVESAEMQWGKLEPATDSTSAQCLGVQSVGCASALRSFHDRWCAHGREWQGIPPGISELTLTLTRYKPDPWTRGFSRVKGLAPGSAGMTGTGILREPGGFVHELRACSPHGQTVFI